MVDMHANAVAHTAVVDTDRMDSEIRSLNLILDR